MQGLIQRVLEEEVREFLGRERYQRRAEVGGGLGWRNGYGKPRKLSTPVGVVEVRRPRVRGLEERFVSRVLPLFARRTREVGELLPELYLHGLSEGDFDLALRGLLAEDALFRLKSVARLKERRAGGVGIVAEAEAGRSGAGVRVGGRGLVAGGAGEGCWRRCWW